MTILDKVKIGNLVKVNLELSKDRLTKETIEAINNLNVPFKHFKTTSVGYFREDIFSNNDREEKLDRLNDQFSEEVTLENIK